MKLLVASPCRQCIKPATVTSRIRWCPQFANVQQHDVCDFWTKLADSCDAADRTSYEDLVGHVHDASPILKSTPYWKRCGWKGYTQTTCLLCGLSIRNHSYEDKLCLSFPDGKNSHLKDSLQQYFPSELLPPPDWCDDRDCKQVGCRKKITVTEVWPEVLCIQLKRWIRTPIPGVFIKENRDMQIPFILGDFEGGPNFEYVLYSAIIHDGAAGSGHYFTLFRPEPTGTWMFASDSSVAVYAGDVQALLKQAFVLFYTKAM